jgi:superfamily II DNA helicase RecQ
LRLFGMWRWTHQNLSCLWLMCLSQRQISLGLILLGISCFFNSRWLGYHVNLVLDEAHVVKEWGSTFRSDYLQIGPIRYLLTWKPTVGIHLGMATMILHHIEELIANLHLWADHWDFSTVDCPNIFFVHKMEHPINSYHDLASVIKQHMTSSDLKPLKFLVFFM